MKTTAPVPSTAGRMLNALLVEAKKQKLTPATFSRRSGLAYASCRTLLRGDSRMPTLQSVMALATVLGCNFVVAPGVEP